MPRGTARAAALLTGRQAAGTLVVITSPAADAVVLTSAFTVTWTTPGAQATFKLQIYSNAAGTTVVYDSGLVNTATLAHNVPGGSILSGATYYVRVFSWGTDGSSAESAIVRFTTAFPTSSNVPGLALTIMGGNCSRDATMLPGINVRWSTPVIGVGETFVSYHVRRRLAGTTAYTTIAVITAIGTRTYTDYTCIPWATYDYAVVWNATAATGTLTSAVQSPAPHSHVDFEHAFIHEVATPTEFVRFEAWDLAVETALDMVLETTVGRLAPTAFVGEAMSSKISLRGLEQLRRDPRRWPALVRMLGRQSTLATMLCVRSGRDRERYFVALPRVPKAIGQVTFVATLELQEVAYDEAAA